MTGGAGVSVAAFDVDGTLTTRDCVVPFLRRFAVRPTALGGLLARSPGTIAALARRDRDALKVAVSEAVFRGVARTDVEREAGREYRFRV